MGWRREGLDIEALYLGTAYPEDARHGSLYSGHIAYARPSGWRFSLEQEPMKWGFGPYGGHLLGTSSAPFPKVRVQSRVFAPALFGTTLGRWNFDWFTGQMESRRVIPQWHQSYAGELARAEARQGDANDYGRPYQSGLLVTGQFLGWIEIQAGLTSMWGGVLRDGRSRMSGLSWANYPLAAFGAENLVAEGGDQADLSNFHALSNGIASLEMRAKSSRLARWTNARGAYWYFAHGGENVRWRWKELDRHPLPAMCGATFALGCQVNWESVDLALELRDNDSSQPSPGNYQTYQNGTFLSGHSRSGDSLGFAQGGGLRMGTVALGFGLWNGSRFRALLASGTRRYVDSLSAWQGLHPGETPQNNHLWCLEFSGQQAISPEWRAGFGLGLKREDHVQFTSQCRTRTNLVLSFTRRFRSGGALP